MTPADFYSRIIVPSAAAVPTLDTRASRVLLTVIAGQESGWCSRLQIPVAHARGYWQFEAGGVGGVIGEPILAELCADYDIPLTIVGIHEALAWHDLLAYAVARLALWQDPAPLPALGNVTGAWEYYLRVWRPGRPRIDDWTPLYAQGLKAVLGQA